MTLLIDRLFRRRLARQLQAIVTFSDATEIFGQRTIRISNGVDFDSLTLHAPMPSRPEEIHLIGVAEVHVWHGYDRLISGLGEYYRQGGQRAVVFHIVGGVHPHERYEGNAYHPGLQTLVDRYQLADRVVFHGPLFGEALDAVFAESHFAIGSLGRHRSGITVIKTLKNREYATRGIPFIYSEQDSDFDRQPYVLKAPADESPIDISQLIDFLDRQTITPAEIRQSVEHLTWTIQMQRVIDALPTPVGTDGAVHSPHTSH